MFQIGSAVTSDKRKTYHSYLIRCWVSVQPASDNGAHRRFVVESIADKPQRWGFDSFDDLVAFLRVALLEDGAEQRDASPPGDA